jgi:ABC-type uncharacterized transport system permease subunit
MHFIATGNCAMLNGIRLGSIIMTKSLLALPALALYLGAAGLLWRGQRTGTGAARVGILALAAGALLLHGAILYGDLFRGDLNLGLTNSASLVAWAVTALFLAAVLFEPVEPLGILILPLSAASVFAAWQWPGQTPVLSGATPAQASHIVISLLAYSLLSVAVVQGLVLGLQERALHRRQAGGVLRNLPPLETMERLLFRMIGVGFLLLTFTLVSGVFFAEQVFGQPLRFTHHIVLSVIAWAVFGTLLVGHWRFGWRGRTAVRLTLIGFALLVLGYFGTKFVLEVLLRR